MVTAMEVGSDQYCAWYEARAYGGVGLIIVQATAVDTLVRDEVCAVSDTHLTLPTLDHV